MNKKQIQAIGILILLLVFGLIVFWSVRSASTRFASGTIADATATARYAMGNIAELTATAQHAGANIVDLTATAQHASGTIVDLTATASALRQGSGITDEGSDNDTDEGDSTPTPTHTPTQTPTPTPSRTNTPTRTPTLTNTPTQTPTPTDTPTNTPIPPTATPTIPPTSTPVPRGMLVPLPGQARICMVNRSRDAEVTYSVNGEQIKISPLNIQANGSVSNEDYLKTIACRDLAPGDYPIEIGSSNGSISSHFNVGPDRTWLEFFAGSIAEGGYVYPTNEHPFWKEDVPCPPYCAE